MGLKDLPPEGRQRAVIEDVQPVLDGGQFSVKRVTGEDVRVEADIFTDGHDSLSAVLRYRTADQQDYEEVPMAPVESDRWAGTFRVEELGYYYFTVQAWVDHFKTWLRDLTAKVDAGQDVSVDLEMGADLILATARTASGRDRKQLLEFGEFLKSKNDPAVRVELALDKDLAAIMYRYPDRRFASNTPHEYPILVERQKARFSTWYEMFPRSAGAEGVHGTFRDVEALLPYVQRMGFDVLYLPPIHPIGRIHRKGKNNQRVAEYDDTGSPWAIGAEEGGHKSIHPELGTIEDFRHLLESAREHGLEIAMDIAFQCAPDHPYVKKHPEWFKHRPDGTIQYAENPPKKYEDIVPFNFESEKWKELWLELLDVMRFWMKEGVRIFRVDNPHTKPFAFWHWALGKLHQEFPDAIFLSEAFTRPKIMYRLARLGFSQSYTYFAWRNTKWELETYFSELTRTSLQEYFRPNVWPNTPDILTEYLQTGGRAAFMIRLILAGTLSSNYGIYGPAFELMEHTPREPHSEEYLHSEKYQIRHWNLDDPNSLRPLISVVNQIRRDHVALQSNESLRFHHIDNDQLLAYSKSDPGRNDLLIMVVNLDPFHTHSGWLELPLAELGIPEDQTYQVHDLLSDSRFLWRGSRNYVELNPGVMPAHILRVRLKVRTEHDFEYFF